MNHVGFFYLYASWTHFSSVTTCLSDFKACSRLWVCSSSLSMATWCCFFCCSSSRSATCRAFILLLNLHTSKKKKPTKNTWAHLKGELRHNSVYRSIAGDVTTYLSSRSTRSCSLLSNQLCLSCSSPSREVAWAFRASQSLASYKNTNKLFCTPLARIKSIGGRRFFYAVRVKMTASHMWYLGTVLVLLFEQSFSSVPLSWALLQVIKLLLQLPIPTK